MTDLKIFDNIMNKDFVSYDKVFKNIIERRYLNSDDILVITQNTECVKDILIYSIDKFTLVESFEITKTNKGFMVKIFMKSQKILIFNIVKNICNLSIRGHKYSDVIIDTDDEELNKVTLPISEEVIEQYIIPTLLRVDSKSFLTLLY